MKEDLPWFKHKKNARASGGAKALIAQYGYEGYGRFAALQEIISEQPGARLDLTLKKNRNGYAGELRMLPADFDAFLVFLADPQECGLIAYVDGVVTTPDLDAAYQSVERKRVVNRDDYESRQPKDNENGNSDNGNADSDHRTDTEQSRAEREERKSASCAREGLPVDKSEEASLAAFALERAKATTGVRNPGAYARKLAAEPDVLAAWRASLVPPPPPKPQTVAPVCPDCGRPARIIEVGPSEAPQAQCLAHRRGWTFDTAWGEWVEDAEKLVPIGAG